MEKKKNLNIYKDKDLRKTPFDYVLVVVFSIVLVSTLYPFLNVLAISLNDATDTVKGDNFIIPRMFTIQNYINIFSKNSLLGPFFMSVARTVVGVVTSLIASTMVAYVISRRDFIFNKAVAIGFILTMYVGGGLIPEFLLYKDLKILGTFWIYVWPMLISAYNVILIRSFMDGLPDALQESARIDGANDFIIYLKIIMPLCKPVLATVALFVACTQWNSWMDTFLFGNNRTYLSTLQFELYKILDKATQTVNDIHSMAEKAASVNPKSIKMAITVVAVTPILVVYPFLQKYFVGGMTLGAVKS